MVGMGMVGMQMMGMMMEMEMDNGGEGKRRADVY